jgi:hypothetical protein
MTRINIRTFRLKFYQSRKIGYGAVYAHMDQFSRMSHGLTRLSARRRLSFNWDICINIKPWS